MRASLFILLFTVLVPIVFGFEPRTLSAFDIVETSSGTLLLDRKNGRTWILKDGSDLHWERVFRESESRGDGASEVARSGDEGEAPSKLVIQSSSEVTYGTSGTTLIRINLRNVTQEPIKNWSVSCAVPQGCEVLSATDRGLSGDGKRPEWRGDMIGPGERRTIEINVKLRPDQFPPDAKIQWTAHYGIERTVELSQAVRSRTTKNDAMVKRSGPDA